MKNSFILMSLLLLTTGSVFASGGRESGERPQGRPPMGGMEKPENLETYEGEYQVEDDIFPSLLTAEGVVLYLILQNPLTEDLLPKSGTEIQVEAVPMENYPERLQVYSLEIEGKPVELEMPKDRRPPGGGSGGGPSQSGGGPGGG